ncbi:MAG: hypothetical protein U0271_01730 [Polyangiaceae bacterium]
MDCEVVWSTKDADDFGAVVPLRFCRATSGFTRLKAPDLDDRGFVASAEPKDYRPARGPTVTLTLGGPEIRVKVIRQAIGPNHTLSVSVKKAPGSKGAATLKVVSPKTSLGEPETGYEVDHLYLVSPHTATTPSTTDDAEAKALAKDERLLFKKVLSGMSGLDESSAEHAQLAELFHAFDHSAAPDKATAKRVADSADPLQERVDALKGAIQRRRSAASQRDNSLFIVSVHLGGTDGPVLAELGVVVVPPIVIDFQPYLVSLGSATMSGVPTDTTHTDFDKSSSSLDYTRLLALVALLNFNMAPTGVYFKLSKSSVRRFRLYDTTQAPFKDDDPDGWNAQIDHYNFLFKQGWLSAGVVFNGVADPFVNILMNCHSALSYDLFKLNVYFVKCIKLGVNAALEAVAVGYGALAQTQPARTLSVMGADGGTRTIDIGEDPVGLICSVSAVDKNVSDWWTSTRVLSRTLAHEIGHVCNLAHYRGGDDSKILKQKAKHDIWAVRNIMHNAETLSGDMPDSGYGRASGYRLAGTLFTSKKHPTPRVTYNQAEKDASEADQHAPDVFTDRLEDVYSKRTDQIAQVREVFRGSGNRTFYGTGAP